CSPPFCDTIAGVCVECLQSTDCAPGETCDPQMLECRGCVTHDDCPSRACLPDGSCGAETDVLYVDPSGDDGGTCTLALPCATLTRAVDLAVDPRRIIKVSGQWSESVTINTKDLVIVAEPTARLSGSGTID